MSGPRLRNGLTPPQLLDELLAKRIETVGRPEPVPDPSPLDVELHKTRLLLRTAVVVAVWEGVLSLVIIGLRMIGL